MRMLFFCKVFLFKYYFKLVIKGKWVKERDIIYNKRVKGNIFFWFGGFLKYNVDCFCIWDFLYLCYVFEVLFDIRYKIFYKELIFIF